MDLNITLKQLKVKFGFMDQNIIFGFKDLNDSMFQNISPWIKWSLD